MGSALAKALGKSLKQLVSGVDDFAASSLAYHIHKVDCAPEPARSPHVIHASDLTKEDFCPRYQALMVKHKKKPKPRGTFASNRLVWDQGNGLANTLIQKATRAGIAVGDWKCGHCNRYFYLQKRPKECPDCEGRLFFYKEVRVTSLLSGGSGSLDLLLDLPSADKLRVVEIKTIDKEKFKELVIPHVEHRERTQFYLRCAAESELPGKKRIDTSCALVFYISKGGWGVKSDLPKKVWKIKGDRGWTPYKEFTIKRDDKACQHLVDIAMPLHTFLQGDGPLPKGVCPSIICSRAQFCDMADPCFKAGQGKK